MNEKTTLYEIRVQGHVARHRFREFKGLTVTHHPHGDTAIAGPIPDQAALYGLLRWLHTIGLPLLSVRRIEKQTGGSLTSEQGAGCARATAGKAGTVRLAPLGTEACPREQAGMSSEPQAAPDRIGLGQQWQNHTEGGRQTGVAGETNQ